MSRENELRKEIQTLTKEYYQEKFAKREYIPGKTRLSYAGRIFDENEITNAVDASLDFWLTEGRFSEQFAEKIADFKKAQEKKVIEKDSDLQKS